MSVTATYTPVLLTGDGSETDFDFGFKVFDDSDLVVALVDPDTLEVTDELELGTDYTVTLDTDADGGTVVLSEAPADGVLVSIRRDISTTQETDIPSGGLFRESQIENALDKAILILQQFQEQVDRALLQNPYSTVLEITFPAPEASKGIGWNATADALENVELPAAAQAAAEAAQTAAETARDDAETFAEGASLGIPEWDSGVTYAANAFVQLSGLVYKSLQGTNLNKNPATETAYWIPEFTGIGGFCLSKNLVIIRPTVATVKVTADRLVLEDAEHRAFPIYDVDETGNIGVAGAGGLDTGAEGNVWYYIWIIRKSSDGTVSALLSAESDIASVTLPSGYDQYVLVGAVHNTSGDFVDFTQVGRRYAYIANPVCLYDADLSTPTVGWNSIDVSDFIPSALSTRALFIVASGTSQNAQLANDGSALTAINEFGPNRTIHVAQTGVNVHMIEEWDILTADTIYAMASAAITVYVCGFTINKL